MDQGTPHGFHVLCEGMTLRHICPFLWWMISVADQTKTYLKELTNWHKKREDFFAPKSHQWLRIDEVENMHVLYLFSVVSFYQHHFEVLKSTLQQTHQYNGGCLSQSWGVFNGFQHSFTKPTYINQLFNLSQGTLAPWLPILPTIDWMLSWAALIYCPIEPVQSSCSAGKQWILTTAGP